MQQVYQTSKMCISVSTVPEDTCQRLHGLCLALSPAVTVQSEVLKQSSNMPDLPLPRDQQPETGDSTPSTQPASQKICTQLFCLILTLKLLRLSIRPHFINKSGKKLQGTEKLSPDSDPLTFWRDSKLIYLQRLLQKEYSQQLGIS